MPKRAAPKAAKAKKAKKAPKAPGTDLVLLEPRYWVRFFRCGCHAQGLTRPDLKLFCPVHMLDPMGDDQAVYPGQPFPKITETGRPSLFNPQRAGLVCAFIAVGWKLRDFDHPERRLEHDGMTPAECERIAAALPSQASIKRWMSANQDFRAQYARAQRAYLEGVGVSEGFDIADDGTADFIFTPKGLAFDNEHVQRSKLRLGWRQWLLERLVAGPFAPSSTVNLKASLVADTPAKVAYGMTDEELEMRLLEGRKADAAGVPSTPPGPTLASPEREL